MPPRLREGPSRLAAPPPETEAERFARRDASAPWQGWKKTARWQRLRLRVLERDGWTCRQTGVLLVQGRDRPNAAVVDHIVPHRGDPALFWDEANLQAVAKEWHDRDKQRQDAADWRGTRGWGG